MTVMVMAMAMAMAMVMALAMAMAMAKAMAMAMAMAKHMCPVKSKPIQGNGDGDGEGDSDGDGNLFPTDTQLMFKKLCPSDRAIDDTQLHHLIAEETSCPASSSTKEAKPVYSPLEPCPGLVSRSRTQTSSQVLGRRIRLCLLCLATRAFRSSLCYEVPPVRGCDESPEGLAVVL